MKSISFKISIALLAIVTYILGFFSIIYINHLILIWSMLSIVLVIDIIIIQKYNTLHKLKYVVITLTAISIIVLLFDLTTHKSDVNVVIAIVTILDSVLIVDSLLKNSSIIDNRLIKINLILGIIAISIIPLPFIFYSVMYNSVIYSIQNKVPGVNVHESKEQILIQNNSMAHIVVENVKYDEEYPNSFLDIYYAGEVTDNRPTMIYIHGGAYVWGDKSTNNKALSYPDTNYNIDSFLEEGLNVISVNYALAPEYKYPTPVIQLSKAVEYLQEYGHLYRLNMEETFYLGWSAGGQIVGQFLNIQTNDEYAKEMGIEPVVDMNNVNAVVFNSALLDFERFDKTNKAFVNFFYRYMGQSYLDTNSLRNNEFVQQGNVINHVTEDFPATYISDGTIGTFQDQAIDLYEKLTSYGIRTEFNYHDPSVKTLPHFYEATESEEAIENREKQLEFMREIYYFNNAKQ